MKREITEKTSKLLYSEELCKALDLEKEKIIESCKNLNSETNQKEHTVFTLREECLRLQYLKYLNISVNP